jgi:phosphate/phosphite/phosphonate ABC transporter binding protein
MQKRTIGFIAGAAFLVVLAAVIWFSVGKRFEPDPGLAPSNSSVDDSGEKIYYLGVLPLENPTVMVERMSRTEKFLQERTGMNIKFKYYPTTGTVGGFSAVVRDIASGNIGLAYLAPVTTVQAHGISNGAVVPFACGQKLGSPVYHGHIAVRQNSGYQKIEDLKGKPVCGSSKSSTSGNLMPTAYLLSLDIDKYDYFQPFDFLGSHDKAAEAVIAGSWEAAFINETTFDKWNKDEVQLRSLYRHPAVPEFPFNVNTNVISPAELAKIQEALFAMHEYDLEGIQMADSKYEKWVPIGWDDYLVTKESVDAVYGSVFYDLEKWDESDN